MGKESRAAQSFSFVMKILLSSCWLRFVLACELCISSPNKSSPLAEEEKATKSSAKRTTPRAFNSIY
jgi:hypothetical protein